MTAPDSWTFVVPGEPVGKGRPRFTRTGHTYTPKATELYEAAVALAASTAIGREAVDVVDGATVAVAVEVVAVFARPKRLTGKGTPAGRLPATLARVDVDNVAKIALDGMQRGGALDNDSHVVRLTASKWYAAAGESPHVEVTVSRLRDNP